MDRIDLLPGETVVSVKRIAGGTRRPYYPDAASALATLARVGSPAQIGEQGPVLASVAEPGVTHPALHSFEAVFGRDSLVSALSVSFRYPRLLLQTLRYLARHQGQQADESKAEEPGRIPHEIRSPEDPVARRLTAELGWGWPYYGSIDATPLFVLGCARCAAADAACLDTPLGRDGGAAGTLRQSVARAAEWLADKMDVSAAGFLESTAPAHGGLLNQTWKDSWDAYSTADGAVVGPPIASVEVQALAFDAARAAARMLSQEAPQLAGRLRAAAARLQRSVLAHLWLSHGGYFALAAQPVRPGGYRPLAVVSSNMGHLLDSGVLAGKEHGELRRRMVEKLFGPELLAAGGIRTLGTREARYRAGSYHNGSCWPWDTVKIARGLRRFGFSRLAAVLAQRAGDVCLAFGGYPEFCRGEADEIRFNQRIVDVRDAGGRMNRIEQPPQQVQAWTVTAALEIECWRAGGPGPQDGMDAADIEFDTRLAGLVQHG